MNRKYQTTAAEIEADLVMMREVLEGVPPAEEQDRCAVADICDAMEDVAAALRAEAELTLVRRL